MMKLETPTILLSRALVTGFFSGYSPKAPGTVGTIAAAALLYLVTQIFQNSANEAILILLLGSWLFGTLALSYLLQKGNLLSSNDDPQEVVIDEFVGLYACAVWFPTDLLHLFLAFLLFRAFDITKPPPIRQLERLPGAWGVMLDDLAAGLIAAAVVFGLKQIFSF